jgi:hypothetical protein
MPGGTTAAVIKESSAGAEVEPDVTSGKRILDRVKER